MKNVVALFALLVAYGTGTLKAQNSVNTLKNRSIAFKCWVHGLYLQDIISGKISRFNPNMFI